MNYSDTMRQRTVICGDCLREIPIPEGGVANKALLAHIRQEGHQ